MKNKVKGIILISVGIYFAIIHTIITLFNPIKYPGPDPIIRLREWFHMYGWIVIIGTGIGVVLIIYGIHYLLKKPLLNDKK